MQTADRRRRFNVLDRNFGVPAPNQKWGADFTYIWSAESWPYVATVIDLFSGPVVGWSMKTEMTSRLVTDALMTVIRSLKSPAF